MRPWETGVRKSVQLPVASSRQRQDIVQFDGEQKPDGRHVLCDDSVRSSSSSSSSINEWPELSSSSKKSRTSTACRTANRKVKRSRSLNPMALEMMESWYERHFHHPYPSNEMVSYFVQHGQLTVGQVKKWMANKRARSFNTLPFNGTIHPKRLDRLRREFISKSQSKMNYDNSRRSPITVSGIHPHVQTPYITCHPVTYRMKPSTPLLKTNGQSACCTYGY